MADTILQQTPAVLNPHPPPASPPNTVGKPAAYWLTLAFRCTLHFRRLARLVHALGGRGVVLGLAAALFCLAGLPLGRSFQGRRLFGSSWLTTMALVYSIYAFQSLSGMAYWGVCPLIASSMMGIYLGTRYNCPHPIGRMTSVAALLVLPMLFSAFKPLAQLGTGAQLALLAAGNLATGHHQGRCVAAATESGRRGLGAGTLFAIDLLASSGGFAIGGLVLPLLFGFTASAWICALGAGLLIHAHCGKTSSHAR